LAGEFDEWEVLLARLAEELGRRTRLESEKFHYERICRLRAPTAKLVYLFLRDHQPQSLATIRHTLGVSKSAGQDALEELKEENQRRRAAREEQRADFSPEPAGAP